MLLSITFAVITHDSLLFTCIKWRYIYRSSCQQRLRREQALSWIIGWALKHCKLPPRRLTYYTTNHDDENGEEWRDAPSATTVYIIISSYDYFAFCLSTGVCCGQSSKAYLLFSVKAMRPHRLGDLFQAVTPKVDEKGPFRDCKLISSASVQE